MVTLPCTITCCVSMNETIMMDETHVCLLVAAWSEQYRLFKTPQQLDWKVWVGGHRRKRTFSFLMLDYCGQTTVGALWPAPWRCRQVPKQRRGGVVVVVVEDVQRSKAIHGRQFSEILLGLPRQRICVPLDRWQRCLSFRPVPPPESTKSRHQPIGAHALRTNADSGAA